MMPPDLKDGDGWKASASRSGVESMLEAVRQYVAGFALPWAWWGRAQCATSWIVCGAATCSLALGIEAAFDAAGGAARQHRLAEQLGQLDQAQQAQRGLPALRASVHALGEQAGPPSVPDSRTLLAAIAAAVERSGTTLDRFEPHASSNADDGNGRPSAGPAQLHLRLAGTFSQLLDSARALAALPLPLIVDDARITRAGIGSEMLDATMTVLGGMLRPVAEEPIGSRRRGPIETGMASVPLPSLPSLPSPALAAVPDPFLIGGEPLSALPGSATEQTDAPPAGHFRLGARAATLLHDTSGWHLEPDPSTRRGPA